MSAKNLYCIAIIPGLDIRESIRLLKEEMRTQFGAKHALKSPAHITLQMPFRREEEQESRIVGALDRFAAGQPGFEVALNGFGCFPPKVIFVKIEVHDPIQELHSMLKTVLDDEIGLSQKEIMHKVFPHMTIATRDLTRQVFKRAWASFEERDFHGSFDVSSIFLLKHNGRHWDIFKEFPFC